MKWAILVCILGVLACDAATGPYEGKGGGPSGRTYSDPARQAACDEAMDRMTDPAKYNVSDPTFAAQQGRDMWNAWQCAESGEINS